VLYNSQHNGVAERKNRSIIETAKSLVHDMDLHMYFGLRLVIQWCIFLIAVLTGS
jgi:hypothetical protein